MIKSDRPSYRHIGMKMYIYALIKMHAAKLLNERNHKYSNKEILRRLKDIIGKNPENNILILMAIANVSEDIEDSKTLKEMLDKSKENNG